MVPVLADENIPRTVVELLRAKGYDVKWVVEAEPFSPTVRGGASFGVKGCGDDEKLAENCVGVAHRRWGAHVRSRRTSRRHKRFGLARSHRFFGLERVGHRFGIRPLALLATLAR